MAQRGAATAAAAAARRHDRELRAAVPRGRRPYGACQGPEPPALRAASAPTGEPPQPRGPARSPLTWGCQGVSHGGSPGPSPARSHRRFPPAPTALRTRKLFRWRCFRFLVTCAGTAPLPPGAPLSASGARLAELGRRAGGCAVKLP